MTHLKTILSISAAAMLGLGACGVKSSEKTHVHAINQNQVAVTMTASDPTADAGRIKFTFEVKDFSGNTEAIDDITVSNRDGRQLGRKVITHNGLYTISVDRQEIIENDKMHIIVASAASAKIELEQNGLIYELIESPDS